jgi:hypothetical protein
MSTTPKNGGWAIRAVFLALVVAALALTSAAQNTSSATTKKAAQKPAATKSAPATTSTTSMGQKVFIDPVTHKPFQPSAEDMKALENAGPKTKQVQTQPKQFVGQFGGVGVKLDESFMMSEVAGKSPDGKLNTTCIEGEKKAASLVKSGKLAAPQTTTKGALDEK